MTSRWRPRNDDGAIGLLSLGMAVLALTVILVVSAASAVHLEHLRLATAADDLALDAADALDLDRYYSPAELGDEEKWKSVQLSEQRMREAVEARLDGDGGRLAGVTAVNVGTPDGTTAVVTVGKVVRPMFGIDELLPFIDGIAMTATSRARAS
jgi:hypothetical protein